MLGDMETKDWLLICTSIAAVVAVFWKTLFGSDKEVRDWAEKRFVSKEIFDLHLDQVKEELGGFREQIAKQHADNRADRATDRDLLIEIVKAVGAKMPPPRRGERPSDPNLRR